MQTIQSRDEVNWEQLRPFLDEAVDQLGEEDRHVVLLRYFQNLSHRDVGAVLGLSKDAARKRANRAVDQLRAHFARRGVAVSAALLAEVVGANSVQAAPTTLAARVSGESLANSAGAAAGLGGLFFMNTKNIIIFAAVLIGAVSVLIICQTQRPLAATEANQVANSNLPAPSKPLVANLSTKIAPPRAPAAGAKSAAGSTSTVVPPPGAPPATQGQIDEVNLFVNQEVDTAFIQYKLAMGHYPSTEDGFQALITCPADEPSASWRGPYIKGISVPLDPWGNPYEFAFPSMHNNSPGKYDCWSDGPDGISGTADDIGNWMPSP